MKTRGKKQGRKYESRGRAADVSRGTASLIWRYCRTARTFAEIVAAVGPRKEGKRNQKTVREGFAWYVADMKKRGLMRAIDGPRRAKLPAGVKLVKGHLVVTARKAKAAKREPAPAVRA